MEKDRETFFAPQLFIPHGTRDAGFYAMAFGATTLRTILNEDGSLHVAELSVGGALFHLHEETSSKGLFDPRKLAGTTVLIGLFVPDVDPMMATAAAAGATIVSPAQDYEYGYRQGILKDPFGHLWMIQQQLA